MVVILNEYSFRWEPFPQPVDMHIQRSVSPHEIVAPYIFDQLLARESPAGVAGQPEEQLPNSFRGRVIDSPLAVVSKVLWFITSSPTWTVCEEAILYRFSRALTPFHQFERFKRLDQIIVRAQLKAP